ncbi:unnamed protein product [Vitrella brassicaformis CCMP3155]|uniref:EF-hand domain-containing protein n=4 Tax=Vitrella brassicaformis TaxID=1169539 RepID=A0A0G4F4B3_VITBC|nr:unnamed protein product [Vitrella brassicaformis CCMP3155]|eukprot:CEM06712.1 unnamed protein product [Vitrella brassicaformis CCMP3155]
MDTVTVAVLQALQPSKAATKRPSLFEQSLLPASIADGDSQHLSDPALPPTVRTLSARKSARLTEILVKEIQDRVLGPDKDHHADDKRHSVATRPSVGGEIPSLAQRRSVGKRATHASLISAATSHGKRQSRGDSLWVSQRASVSSTLARDEAQPGEEGSGEDAQGAEERRVDEVEAGSSRLFEIFAQVAEETSTECRERGDLLRQLMNSLSRMFDELIMSVRSLNKEKRELLQDHSSRADELARTKEMCDNLYSVNQTLKKERATMTLTLTRVEQKYDEGQWEIGELMASLQAAREEARGLQAALNLSLAEKEAARRAAVDVGTDPLMPFSSFTTSLVPPTATLPVLDEAMPDIVPPTSMPSIEIPAFVSPVYDTDDGEEEQQRPTSGAPEAPIVDADRSAGDRKEDVREEAPGMHEDSTMVEAPPASEDTVKETQQRTLAHQVVEAIVSHVLETLPLPAKPAALADGGAQTASVELPSLPDGSSGLIDERRGSPEIIAEAPISHEEGEDEHHETAAASHFAAETQRETEPGVEAEAAAEQPAAPARAEPPQVDRFAPRVPAEVPAIAAASEDAGDISPARVERSPVRRPISHTLPAGIGGGIDVDEADELSAVGTERQAISEVQGEGRAISETEGQAISEMEESAVSEMEEAEEEHWATEPSIQPATAVPPLSLPAVSGRPAQATVKPPAEKRRPTEEAISPDEKTRALERVKKRVKEHSVKIVAHPDVPSSSAPMTSRSANESLHAARMGWTSQGWDDLDIEMQSETMRRPLKIEVSIARGPGVHSQFTLHRPSREEVCEAFTMATHRGEGDTVPSGQRALPALPTNLTTAADQLFSSSLRSGLHVSPRPSAPPSPGRTSAGGKGEISMLKLDKLVALINQIFEARSNQEARLPTARPLPPFAQFVGNFFKTKHGSLPAVLEEKIKQLRQSVQQHCLAPNAHPVIRHFHDFVARSSTAEVTVYLWLRRLVRRLAVSPQTFTGPPPVESFKPGTSHPHKAVSSVWDSESGSPTSSPVSPTSPDHANEPPSLAQVTADAQEMMRIKALEYEAEGKGETHEGEAAAVGTVVPVAAATRAVAIMFGSTPLHAIVLGILSGHGHGHAQGEAAGAGAGVPLDVVLDLCMEGWRASKAADDSDAFELATSAFARVDRYSRGLLSPGELMQALAILPVQLVPPQPLTESHHDMSHFTTAVQAAMAKMPPVRVAVKAPAAAGAVDSRAADEVIECLLGLFQQLTPTLNHFLNALVHSERSGDVVFCRELSRHSRAFTLAVRERDVCEALRSFRQLLINLLAFQSDHHVEEGVVPVRDEVMREASGLISVLKAMWRQSREWESSGRGGRTMGAYDEVLETMPR